MKMRILYFCLMVLAVLLADHASVALGPGQPDRGAAAYRGGLVTPPLPKPRFVLTDTSGAPFDFWRRTQGSVTLLFFGYTYCPDQCPMHMANLAAALKKMPAGMSDQVKLVFVTTDPHVTLPRYCAGGLICLIDVLSASREPKLLSRRSRGLRGLLRPKKPASPTGTTQLRTRILCSHTLKTTWLTWSILAG